MPFFAGAGVPTDPAWTTANLGIAAALELFVRQVAPATLATAVRLWSAAALQLLEHYRPLARAGGAAVVAAAVPRSDPVQLHRLGLLPLLQSAVAQLLILRDQLQLRPGHAAMRAVLAAQVVAHSEGVAASAGLRLDAALPARQRAAFARGGPGGVDQAWAEARAAALAEVRETRLDLLANLINEARFETRTPWQQVHHSGRGAWCGAGSR